MVKIYDRYINIKNREGMQNCTEEMLDILDKMLTEYGVAHAFTLAGADEIKAIEDSGLEYCCSLMYEEADETTCELVYTLWNKVYRKASDDTIKTAMYRMSKKSENMKATCIKWDTDGDRELIKLLPTEIELPDEIAIDDDGIDYQAIDDYLSDYTGFYHFGYVLEN